MTVTEQNKTASVRVYIPDYEWLMKNRGLGSVPDVVHELIMKEKQKEENK